MATVYDGIIAAVEKNRELIFGVKDYIGAHPETGFREYKSSKYMADVFTGLGYDIRLAGNIPGFVTMIDTKRPGPTVMILGELDALICPTHPDADPETGAVHCCGHNAQSAALCGIAAALCEPEILDMFCGKICLCSVPAEELLELDYRTRLKSEGLIGYLGGKTEFLRRGYFDGVDIAMMVHTTVGQDYRISLGSVGCIAKKIIYKGKSAHAGGSPWNGINALYAATLGLSAINSIRETFREPDIIRVHPIMTSGGDAVNAIPERACLESYVRGSSFEAISAANRRVNRALCGAALSIGANIDIQDNPGYAPLRNSPGMIEAAGDALEAVFPGRKLKVADVISSGSTDMGDLCSVMPVIHPNTPGATGHAHGNDYYIVNPEQACVQSAEWQLSILYTLLADNGRRAKDIIASYKAPFASKEEYLAYLDGFVGSGDRIVYNDDGTASVKLY